MFNFHHQRIETWNQPHLQPHILQQYADSIHARGAPLDNCFGFIDGTLCKINRPKIDQRVVYNGHKRIHALKFQSLVLPNGIIDNLRGPYEGRRHDSTMLFQTGLLQQLMVHAHYNANPLCIYGDPAYPLTIHLQSPFRGVNLTANQKAYNKAMSEWRVSVEWLFGNIKNFFRFIDYHKMLKIGLSAVGKFFLVSGLLQNAHTCLYGNLVSEYFNMQPPTLEDYFQ